MDQYNEFNEMVTCPNRWNVTRYELSLAKNLETILTKER